MRPGHTAGADEVAQAAPSIVDLISTVATMDEPASIHERMLAERLNGFAERMRADRFQLAVVGQFKRGKSSLLNALLGVDALPTGVLPLTSLPTFIRSGQDFGLEVTLADGEVRRSEFASAEALQDATAEFVAELANPANVKGVERVELALPSPLLDQGLVLIDTPGIGSTALHNTQAAEEALPECDAALMVLSPDPPITEAEREYLGKIGKNAARVLVACNKIDTAEPADVETIVGFLQDVLCSAGLRDPEIFRVSARLALRAQESGEHQALADSGVPALRDRLHAMAQAEGRQLLGRAIGRKAADIALDLLFENDLMSAALTAPVDALSRRMAAFDAARIAFDRERRNAADQLDGDRRRLLEALDRTAEASAQSLRAQLSQDVIAAEADQDPRDAWDQVRAALPDRLSELQRSFVRSHRAALEDALATHQVRADGLLEELRRNAAELMDAPYQAPKSEAAFTERALPHWVDRPSESLSEAPAGLIERLIPGALGREFARRRIRAEIGAVSTTNVEHMRWACRQNIEDAFRRFGSELDRALADAATGIGEGLTMAAHLRRQGQETTARALAQRTTRRARLLSLIDALEKQPFVEGGKDHG